MKRSLFAILAILTGLAGLCLAAEVLLRFLPVNEGLRSLPLNAENPIPRFTRNRTSTWSRDWRFARVNTVRVNNEGFVSDWDYDPHSSTPLVAVIGDSYVEAAMVPFKETLAGRLARQLGDGARVYSFGMSGAALSTYLTWAEYARDTFRPSAAVFVIIANDFDESLCKYSRNPYCFEEKDGRLQIRRNDYQPSLLREWVRQSALAMYLLTNFRIQDRLQRLARGAGEAYVGNVTAEAADEVLRDSRRAVDQFLAECTHRTGLDASSIVLVVDGVRPQLYEPRQLEQTEGSYWSQMRDYLIAAAEAGGFQVIDMQPRFIERHRSDGTRFEFPGDMHWNSLGHGVAADAVYALLTTQSAAFSAMAGSPLR